MSQMTLEVTKTTDKSFEHVNVIQKQSLKPKQPVNDAYHTK